MRDQGQSAQRDTVLLVEDNDVLRMGLSEQLCYLGWKVVEASTVEEAKSAINQDLGLSFILSDLDLGPGPSGIDLAEWVKQQGHQIPGAIISGYLTVATERITAAGWTSLRKPVPFKVIATLLAAAQRPL